MSGPVQLAIDTLSAHSSAVQATGVQYRRRHGFALE